MASIENFKIVKCQTFLEKQFFLLFAVGAECLKKDESIEISKILGLIENI